MQETTIGKVSVVIGVIKLSEPVMALIQLDPHCICLGFHLPISRTGVNNSSTRGVLPKARGLHGNTSGRITTYQSDYQSALFLVVFQNPHNFLSKPT